jgi:hypothetical protein
MLMVVAMSPFSLKTTKISLLAYVIFIFSSKNIIQGMFVILDCGTRTLQSQ